MTEFKDTLPLDGRVRINWKASKSKPAFTEFGIYRGYLGTNHRRCAVQMEDGRTTWIDRAILETADV